jgi:hypothetical protein
MRKMPSPRTALLGGLVLASLLSGCVIAPARPYYRDEGVVAVAPPPPREEIIGVAPAVGYIWLGGYWGWNGGRHVWYGGHWEAGRPGHYWVPHAWVQGGGGWRLNPGHWERR